MKIIIVDDEKEVRGLMSRLASKEFPDAEVLTAGDYKTAVSLIKEFDCPDAWYILDGDLGGEKTGVDILKAMEEEQRARTVFTSFNPVHAKEASAMGVFCWNKLDFVNGLKKLMEGMK